MRSPNALNAIAAKIDTAPQQVRDGGVGSIVTWLNKPVSQSPKVYSYSSIQTSDLVAELAYLGIYSGIADAAAGSDPQRHSPAANLMKILELSENITVNDSRFQVLLDCLLVAGLLKSDDLAAINLLGKNEVLLAPASDLGLGEISQGDVEDALAL